MATVFCFPVLLLFLLYLFGCLSLLQILFVFCFPKRFKILNEIRIPFVFSSSSFSSSFSSSSSSFLFQQNVETIPPVMEWNFICIHCGEFPTLCLPLWIQMFYTDIGLSFSQNYFLYIPFFKTYSSVFCFNYKIKLN